MPNPIVVVPYLWTQRQTDWKDAAAEFKWMLPRREAEQVGGRGLSAGFLRLNLEIHTRNDF